MFFVFARFALALAFVCLMPLVASAVPTAIDVAPYRVYVSIDRTKVVAVHSSPSLYGTGEEYVYVGRTGRLVRIDPKLIVQDTRETLSVTFDDGAILRISDRGNAHLSVAGREERLFEGASGLPTGAQAAALGLSSPDRLPIVRTSEMLVR